MQKSENNSATQTLFENEESRVAEQRTFPIFGMSRGGTTAVAGCIKMLGLFLGDNLRVNLEDPQFSGAMPKRRETVKNRNEQHAVWGWKFPEASTYLPDLVTDLRNPRLICVTRDLTANAAAIAQRHVNIDLHHAMEKVLLQTQKNYLMITRLQVPTLMVSYEKLIMKPEQSVSEIAHFLGLDVNKSTLGEAQDFIKPGIYRPLKKKRGFLSKS